jgi:hypothetical protein
MENRGKVSLSVLLVPGAQVVLYAYSPYQRVQPGTEVSGGAFDQRRCGHPSPAPAGAQNGGQPASGNSLGQARVAGLR